jgi:hypothetical protein
MIKAKLHILQLPVLDKQERYKILQRTPMLHAANVSRFYAVADTYKATTKHTSNIATSSSSSSSSGKRHKLYGFAFKLRGAEM